jgi:hypothetical protein
MLAALLNSVTGGTFRHARPVLGFMESPSPFPSGTVYRPLTSSVPSAGQSGIRCVSTRLYQAHLSPRVSPFRASARTIADRPTRSRWPPPRVHARPDRNVLAPIPVPAPSADDWPALGTAPRSVAGLFDVARMTGRTPRILSPIGAHRALPVLYLLVTGS